MFYLLDSITSLKSYVKKKKLKRGFFYSMKNPFLKIIS